MRSCKMLRTFGWKICRQEKLEKLGQFLIYTYDYSIKLKHYFNYIWKLIVLQADLFKVIFEKLND